MIALTFTHPDTFIETVWNVKVKSHSPLIEKRFIATADAADYLEPEEHFKGSYNTTSFQSDPLPASDIAMFYLFKRGTQKGQTFAVGASVVPLVGQDYVATRLGDAKPVSVHRGNFFTFALNCRVTELIT